MPVSRSKILAVATTLALAGCSYGNDLLDWATGSAPPAASGSQAQNTGGTTIPVAPAATEAKPQPTNTASPLPGATAATAAPASGATFVGQKAQALAAELGQLQGNLAQHQQALQSALDRMADDVAQLNTISDQAATNSSFGNHLLGEVRSAYTQQGGVNADRDRLRQIETQTIAALGASNQLRTSVSDEIARQNAYLASERNNLAAMASAIQNGQIEQPSLANRSLGASPPPAAAPAPALRARTAPSAATASATEDRPLVVIRFDQPNVDYNQPLYVAVSSALERKASATFTIMAVSPNAGTPAEVAVNTDASRQNAENVLRSLTSMGLPADRITLAAATSPDIQSNEVRIFVH